MDFTAPAFDAKDACYDLVDAMQARVYECPAELRTESDVWRWNLEALYRRCDATTAPLPHFRELIEGDCIPAVLRSPCPSKTWTGYQWPQCPVTDE